MKAPAILQNSQPHVGDTTGLFDRIGFHEEAISFAIEL
jgi:hypothetical protein